MQEIHMDELSKTFAEAIWMTRRFEIDYIWIDSLCIIQDDQADWERESAQMASIYHGAYFTVAATKASGGDGGLFARTPDFQVSGTTPAGEDYYLVFRERIEHNLSVDNTVAQFPLMTRAWVYQERMLSSRVLHFGYHELFFECSTSAYCECGNIGFLGVTESVPLPNPKAMYSTALESVAPTRNGALSNRMWAKRARYYIARIWRSLVMFYTGLHLTVPDDRLAALGGVARKFAEKRKSPYLSGLFKDSLLDDLLWYSPSCKKPRLPEWRAPSWSWASIETHINYEDGLIYYDGEIYTETPDERVELASVEHCTCTPAGVDVFGRVKSASLRITSQILPVTLLLRPDLDKHQRPNYCVFLYDSDVAPRIWPDYDLSQDDQYQVLPGATVYCLRILRHVKDKVDKSVILRALETETGNLFERIGVLYLDPRTPQIDCLEPDARDVFGMGLENAEVRTVDLV